MLLRPEPPTTSPAMEAMRRELDAMRVSVASMVASANEKSSGHGVSANSLVAPVATFTGVDSTLSALDFLSEFRAKAAAKQLAKSLWVPTALAAMAPGPRSYVEEQFAALAEQADERGEQQPWEASWDDLVNVLTTGPWQQRATIFAVRMQLAKLRLQPHQPVEQLVRKVNSLAEKLKGLGSALSDDERTFALQHALIEQVPHWAVTASPYDAKPWASFDTLCSYVLEKDATEPERLRKAEAWKQQGRRRGREAASSVPEGNPRGRQQPEQKRPRTAYAARDKLSDSEREQLAKEGKCFLCKQPGHRAADVAHGKFVCPSRTNKKPSSRKNH